MKRLIGLVLILAVSFCYSEPAQGKYKYKLAVACMFQDEARFMKEWIDFHTSIGVDHFYLYNNDSTDDYMNVLEPYIKTGLVELIQWPTASHEWWYFVQQVQPAIYMDAIGRCSALTEWLALIDLDEFIIPVCKSSIPEVLDNYFTGAEVGGVCMNWQFYGTSNIYKVEPGEKSICKLLYKMKENGPRNLLCKLIVNPRAVVSLVDPHTWTFKPNYYEIDTNGDRHTHPGNKILLDKLRLNHYWTRDEHYFFNVKIPRYQVFGAASIDAVMQSAAEMNEVYDDCILKFVKE